MTAAPPTSELAAFVTRMLDADEAAARAALGWSGSGTTYSVGHPLDPARVLAEVAALRAVVALAEEAHEAAISIRGIDWSVPLEDRGAVESASYGAAERAYERSLRHVAAIWASNPAFDPAWSA